jgi:hypothetical protein
LELKDAIFNQEKINKIQMANLNSQIQSKAFEEERHANIQYAFIATGIITFLILFFAIKPHGHRQRKMDFIRGDFSIIARIRVH